MLLVAAIVMGCSKDDDDNKSPIEEMQPDATKSITAVFAPGQLGDMGYADNLLEGIYRLKALGNQTGHDTLNVHYLTGEDLTSTIEATYVWFEDPYNPYSGKIYEHRLLVLTEPFMVDWIEPLKDQFLDGDEVLVMKMNEADVAAAAQRLGLGNRLHGLNISAASSVRRYCEFIKQSVAEAKEVYELHIELGEISEDDPYIPLNCDQMLLYRLYNPNKVAYRDSIAEVLEEELYDMTNVITTSVAGTVGDGIFSNDGQTSILEEAYKYGQHITDIFYESSYGFHIADLGSAAQGLSYYFMGHPEENLNVLILDTLSPSQFWVSRDFGSALYQWGAKWMRSTETGSMPAIQVFGGWNSNYVTDNIELDDF